MRCHSPWQRARAFVRRRNPGCRSGRPPACHAPGWRHRCRSSAHCARHCSLQPPVRHRGKPCPPSWFPAGTAHPPESPPASRAHAQTHLEGIHIPGRDFHFNGDAAGLLCSVCSRLIAWVTAGLARDRGEPDHTRSAMLWNACPLGGWPRSGQKKWVTRNKCPLLYLIGAPGEIKSGRWQASQWLGGRGIQCDPLPQRAKGCGPCAPSVRRSVSVPPCAAISVWA